ncbi:hypothetical protein DFR52_104269 [Hoeflea marina]|uniref:Uncharacterized protein n=1 Tax=Hoeflea marina TaxID=274592 RepID=A0A317PHR6_9HYPH|nr:DUF6732 family protein [Hoeflea marina]PWV98978.1 hypothetical protein DFR52_104269 [Hoeflea marina]
MRKLIPFLLIFRAFGAGQAHAHGGHLGELAGHSHWVGWAAAAGAAAIAAWAGKRKLNADRDSKEADASADAEPDTQGAEA